MKKTWKLTAGLSALTLVALLQPFAAAATTKAPTGSAGKSSSESSSPNTSATAPTFSPRAGVAFNNPTGTNAERYVLANDMNLTIDATPPGATIRFVSYSFTFNSMVDKLIAAKNRGVKVRVLISDHVTTPQTARLAADLGSNTSKDSYVKRCKNGCMAGAPSIMHAKMYLFSTAGTSKLVSIVGSANMAGSSAASWNNLNTVVGNATVYSSLARYFDDMVRETNKSSYYRTTTSGGQKLFYFPRGTDTSRSTVALLSALNGVTCTGAASGYGNKGRTVIRVEMYNWSAARQDVADKLHLLRDKGCDVEVITNVPLTGSGVMKSLLRKSSKVGVMPVYDGLFDNNHDGFADLYMHHKVLTISGKLNGNPRSKVVFTGSQNLTGNSTRRNNEILFRLDSNMAYDAYAKNLATVRNGYAKKVTKVPTTHGLSAAGLKKLTAEE